MKSRTAVAATLIVGLGVAGCGGSSSKSTSSSTTPQAHLSKTAFLKAGNAICKRGNEALNATGNKLFKRHAKPSEAQRKAFGATAIALIQGEINAIRALPKPAGDEATINKIADTAQKDLDKVKADPVSLTRPGDRFKDANKLANDYGLTECGSGGGG